MEKCIYLDIGTEAGVSGHADILLLLRKVFDLSVCIFQTFKVLDNFLALRVFHILIKENIAFIIYLILNFKKVTLSELL